MTKQMGHKDTAMVTKTYGKWIEQEDVALPVFYIAATPKKLAAK